MAIGESHRGLIRDRARSEEVHDAEASHGSKGLVCEGGLYGIQL